MIEESLPNDLDNALSELIPAVKACSDPNSPGYRSLDTFELMAGTTPGWPAAPGATAAPSSREPLDQRVAGEVAVAFRHCMHEAAMAMVAANSDTPCNSANRARRSENSGSKGSKSAATKTENQGGLSPKSSGDRIPLAFSQPFGLLTLALDFATAESARSRKSGSLDRAISGLPMILLEDFMESQGTEGCKEVWSEWVEPNSAALTAEALIDGSGGYTLIRLSNKLKQRMSKTHDSSFCGQIHIFMSKALGFFDRSGLNVTGNVNAGNVTAFEDEEQFRRSMWGFDGDDDQAGGAERVGDGMDVDTGHTSEGGGEKDEFAVDYRLYQSFWRLQNYALEQGEFEKKGEPAVTLWKALLEDVDQILSAFEANAFSEHDLRLAKERWTASSEDSNAKKIAPNTPGKRKRGSTTTISMEVEGADGMSLGARGGEEGGRGAGDGEGGGYFGLKYLTSSRLLRLQLRDPTLRLQVLTQWLILAASLKNKIGMLSDSPNNATDLNSRMERAKKLVKATPPRGEEYLRMLQTVLHRESTWTQWKLRKCPTIETIPEVEAKAAAANAAAAAAAASAGASGDSGALPLSSANKRQKPNAAKAARERAKHAPLGSDFPLEQLVRKLRSSIPSSEELLQDQRMCAEDPETPASELPSASPLYSWRALRLLGVENPANLAGGYDGDLVKVMKRLDQAHDAVAKMAAENDDKAALAKSALTEPASTGTANGLESMAVDGQEGGDRDTSEEAGEVKKGALEASGNVENFRASVAAAAAGGDGGTGAADPADAVLLAEQKPVPMAHVAEATAGTGGPIAASAASVNSAATADSTSGGSGEQLATKTAAAAAKNVSADGAEKPDPVAGVATPIVIPTSGETKPAPQTASSNGDGIGDGKEDSHARDNGKNANGVDGVKEVAAPAATVAPAVPVVAAPAPATRVSTRRSSRASKAIAAPAAADDGVEEGEVCGSISEVFNRGVV